MTSKWQKGEKLGDTKTPLKKLIGFQRGSEVSLVILDAVIGRGVRMGSGLAIGVGAGVELRAGVGVGVWSD